MTLVVGCAACGRVGYQGNGSLTWTDCADEPTGHCYSLSLEPADWQSAQRACIDAFGPTAHLATISGPAENAVAFMFADTIPYPPSETNPNQRQRMWIGGNDLAAVGAWSWLTSEPFDWQNWRDGEPDSPGVERCLILLGEYDGEWDDRPCDRAYEYLCERD
jgi:hypothetical protein